MEIFGGHITNIGAVVFHMYFQLIMIGKSFSVFIVLEFFTMNRNRAEALFHDFIMQTTRIGVNFALIGFICFCANGYYGNVGKKSASNGIGETYVNIM